ncbi:PA2169 family four-helix-bundle protein [Hymenobacter sp. BT770]|uniref:ferritin-like domain-containing protein n=1 Tax=Hymenobacter sp. BT770 TaxID=2886942 RepID=UPI001D101D72|nr:PA2169 family four-helix-bundle protein [Hymenobacter sp. BT770]MCC3153024.1 PA2169 family four-helix-bundle protein [Hymenobacter sp. BT770]MDO3415063.1 PA2169 family four-helix-bundle protein [Hymenobacter sp. BT770]
MATTTETTARAYNDLVEINKTAAKGYQEAAEGVTNPQLKSELSRLSQQRAQFASELTQRASQYGLSTTTHGTVEGALTDAAAAVHRGWINIKSAITGHDDAAILGECETGDATALQAYETALESTDLPTEAKRVIEQQHSQVLQAKNWVTQQKGTLKR